MALVMGKLQKVGIGVTSLSLTAESNQSFQIKGVYVDNVADADVFATITIDQTTVGYYRVDPPFNMLASITQGKYKNNILDLATAKGYFKGYPVATGQTFTISLSAGTGDIVLVYDWNAPGDIKSTDDNGSDAKNHLTVVYGNNSAAIAASGYSDIDTPNNTPGQIKFPFSSPFPARFKGTLEAIFAMDVQRNTYSGAVNTYAESKRLRLILNNEVLYDLDKVGLLCAGAGAAAGSANVKYGAGENTLPWPRDDELESIWWLEPAISLVSGDELDISMQVSVDEANGQLDAGDINVALLLLLTSS